MALTNYRVAYDNAYETVFLKSLVAQEIMNTRFQADLRYGASVTRFAYDVSNVRVRSTTRGAASTIDPVTDSSELLTINLEKEAVFHISDGERTQTGPLNAASQIGETVGRKVAVDLDARCFAEVRNAANKFDNGDLTTGVSTGTPITINITTTPQMVTRMGAKLRSKNFQTSSTDLVFVVDNYGAADVAQYLLGKNIDLAGAVFERGYTGDVNNAQMYVTENLTGEVLGTTTANFSNGEQIILGGTTLTMVTTIGATPGNVLIGANATASLVNIAGMINNPGTTSANQVALSSADQLNFTDTLKLAATSAAASISIVGIGSGRFVYSETGAAFSFVGWINAYFGERKAIDLVVQNMKKVDMRETADRRGTNIFSSYLAGIKTFADGARLFLDVLLAM